MFMSVSNRIKRSSGQQCSRRCRLPRRLPRGLSLASSRPLSSRRFGLNGFRPKRGWPPTPSRALAPGTSPTQDVQGRYFVVVLPFAALMLSSLIDRAPPL
jgi:hypothetical protein